MEQWVSQRQAARDLGFKSHRAVQKAIESGRIPAGAVQRDENGNVSAVDLVAAKAALAVSTDPVSQADGTGKLNFNGGRGGALLQARAKEKFFAANLRELEYRKQAGDLTSAPAVRKERVETARHVRNTMLAIPDRTASVLASMTSPSDIHKYLAAEIQKALRELSSGLEQRAATAAGADERDLAVL